MEILLRWEFYLGISAFCLILFFMLIRNKPLLEECSRCGYPVEPGKLKHVAPGVYLCERCIAINVVEVKYAT